MDESFCKTWGGFPWFRSDDNHDSIVLRVPPYGGDGRMPWVSLQDDFGDIVHGIFLEPERYHHRPVQAISELIRYEDLAEEFTKGWSSFSSLPPMFSFECVSCADFFF